MTQLYPAFTAVAVIFSLAPEASAFQPGKLKKINVVKGLKSAVPMDLWDTNPVNKIDLDHARECADHFGECQIKEMETMQEALHTERIQHEISGLIFDPVEELDHRLLEEDLTVQLSLLKGEMKNLLPYAYEKHAIEAVQQENTMIPIPRKESFKGFVEQTEDLFMAPNGFADAAAFCIALFVIAFSPVLLK
uniref:Uncharacterized protein n=1 Tax=Chaetoceros debilis TaxID=122233 RepID=A0A7S3PWK5_9STRA|mmetsp:Transcript_28044/g.42974  ORF Transcript_28044/g.42974 Transcript_28044/m.42974 type:complete len:192 (+) Transcript_28044:81-656(+)|eukprot:CAMPEP_0194118466 /NCGR_PEP_ID=MMETSP0150-20130528/35533_1 /TAXON_ID=122233 /ORGANISM="Chaetoceros debilis, Strain MM31A-1" /LENGTH=191 /DNA_ID=CAMNT_0038809835 /DNA_START=50 /DNA_END=625 /DNA_ORIENTATION=-